MAEINVLQEVISLCKRRGFIFQGSEVYGGINGFWDFGPLGVELKNNIKRLWWDSLVGSFPNIYGLDAAIIMHPRVWEASGHVENFNDPMVDCLECKARYKADSLESDTCPNCGGQLTKPRLFNMMFKTFVGANEESSSVAYMRPETAQAIYVNFQNIQKSQRAKVPFGIAQIGKAFRNEINPRNFIFRSREFEQMEMQFFVHPDKAAEWLDYWKEERMKWHLSLGLKKEKMTFHQQTEDELAHYSQGAYDIFYEFPFGAQEIEGIHNRGQYDLTRHQEFAGRDFQYFNQQTREKFVPAIVETSVGADRTLLAVLCDAFEIEEIGENDSRYVMRFSPVTAPIQIAVLPLSKKLAEPTQKVEKDLRKTFRTQFDMTGSIGKLYRRQDEIGTPFCVTFDFDSLKDEKVTVRNRDTMEQERIAIDQLQSYFTEKFSQ